MARHHHPITALAIAALATMGPGALAACSGDDAGSPSPSAATSPSPGSASSTATDAGRPDPSASAATLPPDVLPDGAVELGGGVYAPVPEGWARVGAAGEAFTITNGTTWYSAHVVEQPAGTGPAELLQTVVDEFDQEHRSVSYSPVRYRGTVTGAVPADEYRVTFSAITTDGGRVSGVVQAFIRGDGLAVAVRAWNATATWPTTDRRTGELTDTVKRSLTDAPPIGDVLPLPEVGPFRVASVHPVVGPQGLAGFTVPPGFDAWPHTTIGGLSLAGAQSGTTDLVAIALPAPPTVDDVFTAVVAQLDGRYPGLVVDPPTPQGTRDGVSRLGAGFAGTLGGRPIAGGLDVWLVAGDTAYAFAYSYYADVEPDGSNPEPVATQFAYSAYADSF